MPDGRGVNFPARVEKGEAGGPDKFAEVKPDNATSEQAAFDGSEAEGIAGCADVRLFEPSCSQSGGDPQEKPEEERKDVCAPGQATAAPPSEYEKGGW